MLQSFVVGELFFNPALLKTLTLGEAAEHEAFWLLYYQT
jgi:hypothetical protein